MAKKSYGCNIALKSLSGHAGAMREPCGGHAGRPPHDTYSNDTKINMCVPYSKSKKKSLAAINVAICDRKTKDCQLGYDAYR